MERYFPIYKFSCIIVLLLNLALLQNSTAQNATIRETNESIKTYPFGDPNPVPALAQNKEHIYPYFSFDQYSHMGRSQQWKVVRLENGYIEVSVLPGVGGKVWGAVEKSTGDEFIYQNEVLKFRNIALRGPWTSGGIEFNFGIIGHTPATATPVDYLIHENEDGSVSCIVGALDLSSRTEWRVTITLPKDKAYFETESLWYNPTHLDQSYYVWMNAAVEAADDLQFFFPGHHYIGHSGEAYPWPVNREGVDLSFYRNNDFGPSKSYHVLGKKTEYFGGYWHNRDFGFGHWSRYNDMPGKKLWIWSLSRSGGIWEDLLTDTDGQYVEVQSGRLFNQASSGSNQTPFDQVGFHPSTTDSWKELWFPVKNTDGISTASPHAVLNLDRKKGEVKISLMALQAIEDNLAILLDGKRIHQETVSLEPMEMFNKTLPVPDNPDNEEPLKLVLGKDKLVYVNSSSYLNLDRPLVNPYKEYQTTSANRYYRQARNQVKQRDFDAALKSYRTAIEEDPHYSAAHTGLANLYYRRGEYQTALGHAERTLSYNTYDAAANHIYGMIHSRMGNTVQALEALGWAARSLNYRTASYAAMADIYLRESKFDRAIEYASRSLDFNRKNINAYKALAIAYRNQEHTEKARSTLDRMLQIDPLIHFARFERYLLEPTAGRLNAFTSLIRNELPHETYLELAIYYANAGLDEEARTILEQAPDHPTVLYWQAYLQRDRKNYPQLLQKATASSPHLVFPFRSESIPVFKWAEKQRSHWKNLYYLGLVYWHKGRKKEAVQLFNQVAGMPDYAPFYLTRGKLRQQLNYPNKAVHADYQRANELDPREWRTWHALNEFYLDTGKLKQALETSQKTNQEFPGNDAIEMDHAQSLLYNGRYKEGLNHLDNIQILPFEGASLGHVLFEQTNLFLALEKIQTKDFEQALKHIENSRKWPEHLGVGKPYNPDNRLQDFLEAYIYSQRGKVKEAEKLLTSIAAYTESHRDSWRPSHFISALAYKKLGHEDKARNLLEDWQAARPDDPIVNWSVAEFEENQDKNRTGEQTFHKVELKTNIPLRLLVETVNSINGYVK